MRTGDHQGGFAAANELATAKDRPPTDLYNLTCVCSRCIPPAKADLALHEQYAARALELLHQARERGWFKDPDRVDLLKKDPDLDAIRNRPAFQKLLAELEKK